MEQFDLDKEYGELHSHYPVAGGKPIIGITANFNEGNACLAEAYYASVLAAGGVPLLIPPYLQRDALADTLDVVDAVVLSGGADIDPRYMNEEPDYSLLHTINPKRDAQELLLALREGAAGFVDDGIRAIGQAADEAVRMRCLCCIDYSGEGGIGVSTCDVFSNSARS